MSAVCWIPACWKFPVTQGSNHSLQFACSDWKGKVCSAVAPAQCLDSNWERSRCHSLLWSLLLVYQVHPVSMSACMNCGPQSPQQLQLVYHPLNRPQLLTLACLLTCFKVGSECSVDHASGGVRGVLASPITMVEKCCGTSFLILPLWGKASHELYFEKQWSQINFNPSPLARSFRNST